ncbi:hypothetical protein H0H92_004366 [Tricholoma furcatifolium]|nr:hypothetical protein H0H92_004366 [Tricholoma furcatifolium]
MAHPKRVKSAGKTSKKHAEAKQAVKKLSKGAAKFRSEQLRTMLDAQTSTLYSVIHPSKKDITAGSDQPIVDVQDLTSTLGRL